MIIVAVRVTVKGHLMDYQEVFRERLKSLRLEHGERQEDLGKAIGITKAQVSRIESGQRAITFGVLMSIREHYKVTVDYLLGFSDDPKQK